MGYAIIKKVLFKDDGVYISSAESNVYPRYFSEFRSEYYSNLLQTDGFQAVVRSFAEGMQSGVNKFLRGCKFNNAMLRARDDLLPGGKETLTCFLDSETYSNYVVERVDSIYTGKAFAVADEIQRLMDLRRDVKAVLDICERNPEAFLYSDDSVQRDREAALKYVEKSGGELMFSIPQYFRDDKEIVLKAVQQHGCCLRRASARLCDDAEVVLAAFSAEKYPEHLPDLISPRLLRDAEFMKKIIEVQPHLHFSRAKALFYNPEIVLTLAEKAVFVTDFRNAPQAALEPPEVQKRLAARLDDEGLSEDQKQRRFEIFAKFVKPEFLVPAQLKGAKQDSLDSKIQEAKLQVSESTVIDVPERSGLKRD